MNDDFLVHYGVLGMKWGVRKQRPKSSRGKKSRQKKYEKRSKKTYEKKIKARKKSKYSDISRLSDSELRARVNRMQLERQYVSLLKTQSKVIRKGRASSENILVKNGKQIASQVVKKNMKKIAKV